MNRSDLSNHVVQGSGHGENPKEEKKTCWVHTSKKRRLSDSEDEQVIGPIPDALASYGERFMEMFQPTEVDWRRSGKGNNDASQDMSQEDSIETDEGSDGPAPVCDTIKGDGGFVNHIFGMESTKAIGSAPPDVQSHKKNVYDAKAGVGYPRTIDSSLSALERKRFMSHKANVISGAKSIAAPLTGRHGAATREADGTIHRKEFDKMQRDVQLFGAVALDNKAKSQLNAAMLEKIGAKRVKGPRIPASIGMGMAKKKSQREARALEEAIATGMVRTKAMGKKKHREKRAGLDRGLGEDRGAFRNGVLRVMGGGGGGEKKKTMKKGRK